MLKTVVSSDFRQKNPGSLSCERVFSLVKPMFGDQQLSSLADYIQAALMLRYNERPVGWLIDYVLW